MFKNKIKYIISFITGIIIMNYIIIIYFFKNTKLYTIKSLENIEINLKKEDIIFIYQKNRTDELFYNMLKYSDNIIFVGDKKWKCKNKSCLQLENYYDYKSLDVKLIDTFTQLLKKYPNAKTFSKLDDDAIIHPILYEDLIKNIEKNNYAGILREYKVDNIKIKYNFMEGHFYMLEKELVKCFLKNSRISQNNMPEDMFLGKVLSIYCYPKFLDLKEINLIWHREYNIGKNKKCILEQKYENDEN